MGTHQPGHGPDTTTTLGPRRTAARHRKRRALLLGSAAGAALLVGGTATAAVIATGTTPEDASQAATVPEAATDPLQSSADGDQDQRAEPDDQAGEEGAQGSGERSGENATSSSQGEAVTEQSEQPQDESSGADEDQDPSGGQPTGEGGTCEASFYGEGFHGSTTANGETFDTQAMTAAHKTLPFDTQVEVTNPDNGQSVTVRINDRGPYIDGRCLDLSTAAFDEIIGTGSGVGTVDWQVVS
ncbi:septal ring lytic transglycosylase RlpA family protein [Nocardiopsis salina]|uniref:septal ring lytic transglycosylase RlpA family protein n=1 Tax=Nocardiopsis salina TaxID=245836 RepID=UPI00034C9241|nr:septal ring lytic transglycosylase RlpA family protein [Nocardiopsis salina]